MSMNELRAEMAEEILGAFGDEADYRVYRGVKKTLRVRVRQGVEIIQNDVVVSTTLIGVPESEISNPQRGDKVSVKGGESYELYELINRSGGLNWMSASLDGA